MINKCLLFQIIYRYDVSRYDILCICLYKRSKIKYQILGVLIRGDTLLNYFFC